MIMKMPGKMMVRKGIRREINIEERVPSPEGKSGHWYLSFHCRKLVKEMPAELPLVKNKQPNSRTILTVSEEFVSEINSKYFGWLSRLRTILNRPPLLKF